MSSYCDIQFVIILISNDANQSDVKKNNLFNKRKGAISKHIAIMFIFGLNTLSFLN